MKNTSIKIVFMTIGVSLLLLGCSAKQDGIGKVGENSGITYGDTGAVETVTMGFGSTDLQMTAEAMTQSLLESKYIAKASQPPKVRLRDVQNNTYEHIDTKAITDKIRVKLLKSGAVRFLADKSNLSQVGDERDLTETATKKTNLKAMTESDYIITGTVRSIVKANNKTKDVYYNISMELVDYQSGEILWADEKEIRKTSNKPKVGW